jgi:cAMP-dependent protein kinase regulator
MILHQIGQQGDYFYIIEIGSFQVLVNGLVVATLEEGRSFGELALLYNTPRAATVRASRASLVYSLDRDTFRNTLANSSFSKVSIRDSE